VWWLFIGVWSLGLAVWRRFLLGKLINFLFHKNLMPTKVSTQKWIQYDHYVAYKNRVIENSWIGNLNCVPIVRTISINL
jgi:hypothetical protein